MVSRGIAVLVLFCLSAPCVIGAATCSTTFSETDKRLARFSLEEAGKGFQGMESQSLGHYNVYGLNGQSKDVGLYGMFASDPDGCTLPEFIQKPGDMKLTYDKICSRVVKNTSIKKVTEYNITLTYKDPCYRNRTRQVMTRTRLTTCLGVSNTQSGSSLLYPWILNSLKFEKVSKDSTVECDSREYPRAQAYTMERAFRLHWFPKQATKPFSYNANTEYTESDICVLSNGTFFGYIKVAAYKYPKYSGTPNWQSYFKVRADRTDYDDKCDKPELKAIYPLKLSS